MSTTQTLATAACAADFSRRWRSLCCRLTAVPLVRAGESQPLLLTARSFSDTPPGVYTADVVLSDGRTERAVALSVRVWDFAIPKEHGLLTLWGDG